MVSAFTEAEVPKDLASITLRRGPMMTLTRQDVFFDSLGQKVAAALFLPEGEKPAPALIVCHGAGEYKENYFEMCEQLCRKGVAALAVDMHGHGKSGGERYYVDMREWVADVIAAVDFLSNDSRIETGRIGAFGLSSGGTAILEAALVEPRLKALIALDATVRTSMPLAARTCATGAHEAMTMGL